MTHGAEAPHHRFIATVLLWGAIAIAPAVSILAIGGIAGCEHVVVDEPSATTPGGAGGSATPSTPGDVPRDATLASLDAGGRTTCGVTRSGHVVCWGAGEEGQLGDGSRRDRGEAAFVLDVKDVAEVVVGRAHACARTRTGAVSCWGRNAEGQLGDGTGGGASAQSARPVAVKGLTDAEWLVAGDDHTCAKRRAGSIVCWGDNRRGQLMNEGRATWPAPVLLDLRDTTKLVLGGAHSCAIRSNGGVLCWGAGRDGQLSGPLQDRPRPGRLEGAEGVVDLVAGGNLTCAKSKAGVWQCWGGGDASAKKLPVSGGARLVLGERHGCAIDGGLASCWGDNGAGQLGNGTLEASATPVRVSGVASVASLALGRGHTCAVSNGRASCWGDNGSGALGSGPPGGMFSSAPETVVDLDGVVEVVTGEGFSCARRQAGDVACWGRGDVGQLGDGKRRDSVRPTPVPGLAKVIDLDARDERVCAVTNDGKVACWGKEADTADGKAGRIDAKPRSIQGVANATTVAVGVEHTCATRRGDDVTCWGSNLDGRLGAGDLAERSAPASVKGTKGATVVVAGRTHSCARTADGRVACWGGNRNGQLGNGTDAKDLSKPRPSPVFVTKLDGVVELVAGHDHNCARTSRGEGYCWGRNDRGQLGSGTSSDWTTRVPIRGLKGLTAIASTSKGACAVQGGGAGRASCWGEAMTRTANGQSNFTREPVPGPTLDAASLAVTTSHACAVTRDGRASCWGLNDRGQLGNGAKAYASSPEPVPPAATR